MTVSQVDAIEYLQNVRTMCAHNPATYNAFLQLMTDFRDGNVDALRVVDDVRALFAPSFHIEPLLSGFGVFLPPTLRPSDADLQDALAERFADVVGVDIDALAVEDDVVQAVLEPVADEDEVIHVQPLEARVMHWAVEQVLECYPTRPELAMSVHLALKVFDLRGTVLPYRRQDLDRLLVLIQDVLLDTRPDVPQMLHYALVEAYQPQEEPVPEPVLDELDELDDAPQPPDNAAPAAGATPNPTFQSAVDFISTIQAIYADRPGVYAAFLQLLRDYQVQEVSVSQVYKRVAILFRDHLELMEGLRAFLPDNVNLENE